jgi:hypothetical protein
MTAATISLTLDEAVAKAMSLIEARDYVTFAELGHEIPGFTAEPNDDGYVIGIGDAVWWVATRFGWGLYLDLHNRVSFHPSTLLVYLVDGGFLRVKKPNCFVPMTLRPRRFTDFVSVNGLAWSIGADKKMWAKFSRSCGKVGLAEGKRKARELAASTSASA